jgi:hypothetical protein
MNSQISFATVRVFVGSPVNTLFFIAFIFSLTVLADASNIYSLAAGHTRCQGWPSK